MADNRTSGRRIAVMITVSLAVIIFYGTAVTLFGMTLVRPFPIVGGAILAAGVSALTLRDKWRMITASDNVFINVICHLVAATGLCMALILGVNYFGRDTSDSVPVRAEIVKVYSETRYRAKRVARNRYTRGEPYQLYFMDVRLPDGRECKRSISLQRYNRFAWSAYRHRERRDSVDLFLTKGALGMTVIERDSAR